MADSSWNQDLLSKESSERERDFRWRRVREFMDERDLDGLIVFASERPGADHYLTNDRPGQHVIFPREGKIVSQAFSTQVVAQNLVSRERGEGTWLEDIRVGMTGDGLVSLLREKGLENKRVGAVGAGASGTGSTHREGWVSYQTWLKITQALPNIIFEDVTLDFVNLMLVRSQRDIACLRRAAAAGEAACQAIMEAVRVGATEMDVYAAGMCAFHKSRVHATHMILTSGAENFSWGIPPWTWRAQAPRVFKEGDIVMAELFPHYGGMDAQQQLAVAIGEVHPDHETCAKAARKSYEAGLAEIKPGATFRDVCDAMEKPIEEIGGWHLTPLIHDLNPLVHTSGRALDIEKQVPEIAQQYVNVRGRALPAVDYVLKAGMSLEPEPNAHIGRRRVNIGGTVVVTEIGVEELNELPNNLQRIPGSR